MNFLADFFSNAARSPCSPRAHSGQIPSDVCKFFACEKKGGKFRVPKHGVHTERRCTHVTLSLSRATCRDRDIFCPPLFSPAATRARSKRGTSHRALNYRPAIRTFRWIRVSSSLYPFHQRFTTRILAGALSLSNTPVIDFAGRLNFCDRSPRFNGRSREDYVSTVTRVFCSNLSL